MPITLAQLDEFHRFAAQQIAGDGGQENDLDWPEIFDLWRIENPAAREQAEIYAALDAAQQDVDAGRHRPATDVLRDVRAKRRLSQ